MTVFYELTLKRAPVCFQLFEQHMYPVDPPSCHQEMQKLRNGAVRAVLLHPRLLFRVRWPAWPSKMYVRHSGKKISRQRLECGSTGAFLNRMSSVKNGSSCTLWFTTHAGWERSCLTDVETCLALSAG